MAAREYQGIFQRIFVYMGMDYISIWTTFGQYNKKRNEGGTKLWQLKAFVTIKINILRKVLDLSRTLDILSVCYLIIQCDSPSQILLAIYALAVCCSLKAAIWGSHWKPFCLCRGMVKPLQILSQTKDDTSLTFAQNWHTILMVIAKLCLDPHVAISRIDAWGDMGCCATVHRLFSFLRWSKCEKQRRQMSFTQFWPLYLYEEIDRIVIL